MNFSVHPFKHWVIDDFFSPKRAKRLSEEIAGLEAQIAAELSKRGEDLIATNRALTQILNELQSQMGVAGGVDIGNMGLSKSQAAAYNKYIKG